LDATKLVVNQVEAEQVRKIFLLYLQHRGLIAVVRELERRGWSNKRLMTREGSPRGGKLFTKTSLHRLLTNVTYIGKTLYKGTLYDGQHDSIVDQEIWDGVQAALALNGKTGGKVRHPSRALLKHILHCRSCGCAMPPSYVVKGNKRYHYYVCSSAQKRGWETCPSKAVAAHEIEHIVVNQIQGLVTDPVWEALPLSEQTGRINQLVERIDYDGRVGKVWIVFRSSAVQSLAAASPLAHSETTT
jgi:site-specific DNA recombinase